MRRLFGALIGLLLFFPGAEVLKWLVVRELRLYQEMTLTDALLAIIIVLASMIIFGQPRRALSAEELERQAKAMELASRRLEEAQRRRDALRRGRRPRSSTSSPETAARRARPASSRRRSREEDEAGRRRRR